MGKAAIQSIVLQEAAMDSKICLLFFALFFSLINNESLAKDVNINFKVLKRTMEENHLQPKPGNANSLSPSMKEGADEQRSSRNPGTFYETTISWDWFTGYIPSGAVSYWNDYANRVEYPCMLSDCSAGYYSPSRGSYCYYPNADKEYRTSAFWILVNGHNFETLTWRGDSWGDVPSNSINTCSGVRVYVGKNQYGLGKVVSDHEAFFIVLDGKEKWYKNYDVLTINKNYHSQSISNVYYDLSRGSYSEDGIVIATSKLTNKDCKPVKKTTILSGTVTSEHTWEIAMSISQSTSFSMTAGIPSIVEGSWGISSEKTFSWNKGYTYSESVTYTEEIEVEIPPNHSCELALNSMKMRGQIPFTATAIRYYGDGTQRSATVQGVSHNAIGLKGESQVERCVPIPNALPCPT